jgi:2'-5' RNA ligase
MPLDINAAERWVIVIFLPPSAVDDQIARYRDRYDPLAARIAPHVTLVHPFVDEVSPAELRSHVAGVASSAAPFRMTLADVTPFPDGYLYLNVKTGNDTIVGLRDRLYSGALARHKSRRDTFVPHVTIGRAPDPDLLDQAMADAEDLDLRLDVEITEICAYRFDEHDRRVIDFAMPLGLPRLPAS